MLTGIADMKKITITTVKTLKYSSKKKINGGDCCLVGVGLAVKISLKTKEISLKNKRNYCENKRKL